MKKAMSNYAELLRDPRWQRKRLEVLDRAQFRCEECMDDKATLHVHHKIYRKGAKPWEYENYEFLALCESCHAEYSELQNRLKEAVRIFDRAMFARLVGYAETVAAILQIHASAMNQPLRVADWYEASGVVDALHPLHSVEVIDAVFRSDDKTVFHIDGVLKDVEAKLYGSN